MSALAVAVAVAVVAVPRAIATERNREETPVTSSSPVTSVLESVVRVRVPLPGDVGPHPAACDWLSYLRYRDRSGPTDPERADRVLIAQPGIFEGAGAFDSVARDTVAAASRQGKHLEFWALDRRSNCLEDHTGPRTRDPHSAVDYYYRGKRVDGHTFAGYLSNGQVAWLAKVGLEQTVRDEYDLMTRELPDQSVRRQKVLCGGHSLGGTVTGFFVSWDFDGNPGYQQCAGYFALDSAISTSLSALNGMPSTTTLGLSGLTYTATQLGLDSGLVPRILALPTLINPETMNLLGIAGLAAEVDPNGESDLARYVPSNANLETTYRVLFSRDAVAFATGVPSIRDFRITNAAALGALLDDNSQPLAFLESSVGFFTGGRIADKNFPLPQDVQHEPTPRPLLGTFGKDRMAIPDQPRGPLYRWLDYDQVDGRAPRYTTPGKEVTALAELARSLAEQPLDFTEQYFPTKLVTDIDQADAPQIHRHVKYPGAVTARPTINLLGGDGLVVPNGLPQHGENVVAPGYQHLDVLTAAPVQNDGQPDLISTSLARFAVRESTRAHL